MKKGTWWFSPNLDQAEREAIEKRMDQIAEEQRDLKIKPTRSGEVGFRPLKLGQPSPETPHERFKRERAERLRKEAAATKPRGGGGRKDSSS